VNSAAFGFKAGLVCAAGVVGTAAVFVVICSLLLDIGAAFAAGNAAGSLERGTGAALSARAGEDRP
jgi:hypothetical protein